MQEHGLPAAARTGLNVRKAGPALPVSGHVFRVQRKRGPVWYAKYRLPDGRQVQRKLGPAWSGRGRPADGYLTRRLAQELLEERLSQARKGTLPGLVRTGITVKQAAEEYLRYIEHDRERKPSTVKGYRWLINAQILPPLGELFIEDVTPELVEAWLASLKGRASSRRKTVVLLHGIFKRARKLYRLPLNPVADVEKPTQSRGGEIAVLSPEEVWALVRAAASDQDAAIFLTAAFRGCGWASCSRCVGATWTSALRRSASNGALRSAARAARSRGSRGRCRWCARSPPRSPGSGSGSASSATRT